MWVLIVVMAFYQRGPQPDVRFQEFQSEKACITAANWTSQVMKTTLKEQYKDEYSNNDSVSFRVQCFPKGYGVGN